MSMPVGPRIPTIDTATGKIGVIASAGGFAGPLLAATNHLAGYKLAGLLHHQKWETAIGGTGRFYTYRVPNCNYLVASGYIESIDLGSGETVVPETDAKVTLTAGSGTGTSVQASTGKRFCVAFPWGAADTWAEVTYEVAHCAIRTISIWCLCRETLGSGDDYIESVDTGNLGAGFNEGEYIIQDPVNVEFNISGLAAQILNVRNNTVRQAVSWSDPGEAGATLQSASYANPFEYSLTFAHTARTLTASITQKYRVYAYTMGASLGAETYSWKVTTAAGNAEKTGITRASYGWDYVGDLDLVGSGTESTLTFEMTASASATPVLYVAALSICAQPIT